MNETFTQKITDAFILEGFKVRPVLYSDELYIMSDDIEIKVIGQELESDISVSTQGHKKRVFTGRAGFVITGKDKKKVRDTGRALVALGYSTTDGEYGRPSVYPFQIGNLQVYKFLPDSETTQFLTRKEGAGFLLEILIDIDFTQGVNYE